MAVLEKEILYNYDITEVCLSNSGIFFTKFYYLPFHLRIIYVLLVDDSRLRKCSKLKLDHFFLITLYTVIKAVRLAEKNSTKKFRAKNKFIKTHVKILLKTNPTICFAF